MAVDFVKFSVMEDRRVLEEAASAGLKSMEHLIHMISNSTPRHGHGHVRRPPPPVDCSQLTDYTVSKFKTVISILNRTGHARFRRAPVQPQPQLPLLRPAIDLNTAAEPKPKPEPMTLLKDCLSLSQPSAATTSSSFLSTITGDGSVSNGKAGAAFAAAAQTPAFSAGKPPLSFGHKKKCHEHALSLISSSASAGRCHCSKRRKHRVKRTIRVPAISSKNADIPPDEFSWRKYGQKPIKGSPFPRGYYRCSSVRGCPARKHVERAQDDPTMLIVTYEGDHRHNAASSASFPPLPEPSTSSAPGAVTLLFHPS